MNVIVTPCCLRKCRLYSKSCYLVIFWVSTGAAWVVGYICCQTSLQLANIAKPRLWWWCQWYAFGDCESLNICTSLISQLLTTTSGHVCALWKNEQQQGSPSLWFIVQNINLLEQPLKMCNVLPQFIFKRIKLGGGKSWETAIFKAQCLK